MRLPPRLLIEPFVVIAAALCSCKFKTTTTQHVAVGWRGEVETLRGCASTFRLGTRPAIVSWSVSGAPSA
jgi:hypothetical protein